MIRAIFFDFDGVLTLNERGSTVTTAVIHELNPDLPLSKIRECYYKFHHELLSGARDHRGIWNDFCACLGRGLDPGVLEAAFSRTPVNEKMLELASELAQAYRLGIITDNALDRMTCLVEQHALDTLFDPIVISAQVRKMKDDAGIFMHALEAVGCQPDECVFIDNQEKNLAVPASLGFQTYHFDPRENDAAGLKRQFREWGVTIR